MENSFSVILAIILMLTTASFMPSFGFGASQLLNSKSISVISYALQVAQAKAKSSNALDGGIYDGALISFSQPRVNGPISYTIYKGIQNQVVNPGGLAPVLSSTYTGSLGNISISIEYGYPETMGAPYPVPSSNSSNPSAPSDTIVGNGIYPVFVPLPLPFSLAISPSGQVNLVNSSTHNTPQPCVALEVTSPGIAPMILACATGLPITTRIGS